MGVIRMCVCVSMCLTEVVGLQGKARVVTHVTFEMEESYQILPLRLENLSTECFSLYESDE